MSKNTLNYIIDAIMAALMLNIVFIGALLGFVIPKGERAGYAPKVLWGLHRHDWGEIHMYLSLALVAVLIVHVWLHWSWVAACTRRLLARSVWALVLAVLLGAAAVLGIARLVSPRTFAHKEGAGPPVEREEPRGRGRRGQ